MRTAPGSALACRATINSAMKRAKLAGLKRNATVTLGNVGRADDVQPLMKALADADPTLREHTEWAVRQINERTAR